MLSRNQRMPLILMVLVSVIIVAACSGTPVINPSPNITPTSQSQRSGSEHKLFVFLSGFTSELSIADAAGNGGYGSDPDFFGNGRIQPFLQAKFPGSYFLTYSYSGFTSEGKPNPYTCPLATDSDLADLAVGLYSQISQFLRSHPNTQNTDVYVIGHSLGGVIAFSFLSQMIEGKGNLLNSLPNRGILKGVFTLDSPIGGVSDNGLYVLISMIHTLTHCNDANFLKQPVVKQLNDLFNSAPLPDFRGATASIDAIITLLNQKINETVAFDAMQHGITVSTFGNTNDVLWQPNLCTLSLVQDFFTTQWLREVKAGRNSQGGAVYARSFARGPLGCSAIFSKSDPANHFAVLTEPNIQTAIWQVITGDAPNALPDMPLSVYISSQDGSISALNAGNGKLRWKYQTGFQYTTRLHVADGIVYFILDEDINTNPNATSTLYELDVSSGTLLRKLKLPYFTLETGAYIPDFTVVQGVIYLSTPGMLFAVKASDGTQLWQHLCSCRGASVPVVLNNVVYFASETGEIDAINSRDGTQVWQYTLPPEEVAPGAITGNDPAPLVVNNIVYEIEPFTDNVYALNANDGTLHWHIHLNNEQTGTLSTSNGVLYVTTEGNSSANNNLYALQTATGGQLWSKQNLSLQLIAADTLYCFGVETNGGFTNDLYALHALDGTTLWHRHFGGSLISYTTSYMLVDRMTVYVMTDTTLYALHAYDGSIAWQSSISGYMAGP